MNKSSPLVLLILDGWGCSDSSEKNAIYAATTPQWDAWCQNRPMMLLDAAGAAVGLPEGQMGNSEVGHMHIGAGRSIPQDCTRINTSILDGHFKQNPSFIDTLHHLQQTGNHLHVVGLLSPGGVHSHEAHLFRFLECCAEQGFHRVMIHVFLDGRDAPPRSALESLNRLETQLRTYPVGQIASVCGRYYAMDRDARWERIKPVYELMTTLSTPHHDETAAQAVATYYAKGISDEFIPPILINGGVPVQDNDALFFFNFRADRARQLTRAFVDPAFDGFERHRPPKLSAFLSMTPYAADLNTLPVFPALQLKNTLGEVLASAGLRQLRVAETEKYAHVTFFFNGGIETPFSGEDRKLIPSAKVATYDLEPAMRAREITSCVVEAINRREYDVIICNYANADMVGHTGNFPATVAAIECLDSCLAAVYQALEPHQGHLLITADHGNAEMMYDPKTGQPHTAHTTKPVPFLYIGTEPWVCASPTGRLIDIAPTILRLLNLAQPKEMLGTPLLT